MAEHSRARWTSCTMAAPAAALANSDGPAGMQDEPCCCCYLGWPFSRERRLILAAASTGSRRQAQNREIIMLAEEEEEEIEWLGKMMIEMVSLGSHRLGRRLCLWRSNQVFRVELTM